jgi:hypothetical protein
VNITVFLGPSLSRDEARRILPDAVFRAPVAQGDLLSCLNQDHPDIVAVIDGTFHQNLSVWHAEICYVLNQGVSVYGASSMGALRAVETAPFGMVGIGQVFEWYRDGRISADDEVALIHATEELGYRPLSEPLVNIRATLDQAFARGRIASSLRDQVVAIAQSMHYPERRIDAILRACSDASLPPAALRAVRRALTEAYVDIKQADARTLLETLRDLGDSGHRSPPAAFEFNASGGFDGLYNIERKVRHSGIDLPLQSIAEHVALHATDFDAIRAASLHRAICLFFASLVDVTVTHEEVLATRRRFTSTRALDKADALSEWLRANDLSPGDFDEFIHGEAVCARLREWILGISQFDRGAKQLLDELRRRGTYTDWAARAAEESLMADTFLDTSEYQAIRTQTPATVAEQHGDRTGVRVTGDAASWADEHGFDSVVSLETALRRAAVSLDVRDRIARLSSFLTTDLDSEASPSALGKS